jgi:hypothetical protein
MSTVLQRFKPTGAGTPESIRQKPPPVRAQGIEGARSGRAKNKKHALHVFYF